ncbi:PAAR domain-containing protein [Agromyces sp. Leaf222]|uniref:PAAR domain-containing protein n=1 Tax=Agromyces sp. Leaf222 TaxID=1735688 RepID=UPI0007019F93|nr:PAAR domain-containing protein [Agromyces sp. Leaf222]KQM82327.1 type VI secretion protein [Agromyces sp. Leaf222]
MPTGPALRAGDTALCALMDGPKPHVGGPITPAAAVMTVLIANMPAAVANAMPGGIVCVSPAPNGIAMGSMTVLIGGFPAARVGDLSMHGQPIAPGPGAPTVIIGG